MDYYDTTHFYWLRKMSLTEGRIDLSHMCSDLVGCVATASLLPHDKEQFLAHSKNVNCSKHLSKELAVGEPPAHVQASPSGSSRPGWLQHAHSRGRGTRAWGGARPGLHGYRRVGTNLTSEGSSTKMIAEGSSAKLRQADVAAVAPTSC